MVLSDPWKVFPKSDYINRTTWSLRLTAQAVIWILKTHIHNLLAPTLAGNRGEERPHMQHMRDTSQDSSV